MLVACLVPTATAASSGTCVLCGGQKAEQTVNIESHLPEETLVGGPAYQFHYSAQSPTKFTGEYNGITIDKIRLSLDFRYLALPSVPFSEGSKTDLSLSWNIANPNIVTGVAGTIGITELSLTPVADKALLCFVNEVEIAANTWYTLMLECDLATDEAEFLLTADGNKTVSLGSFRVNVRGLSWSVLLNMNNLGDCADPNRYGIGVKNLSIDAVKEIVIGNPLCPHDFSEPIRGDMNGDGKLDSDDAIYLLRSTMSANYPLTQSGDVNGDGKTDSNDAIHLLRHVLLPERFPLAA